MPRSNLSAVLALASLAAAPVLATPSLAVDGALLAPHRAVYDLSLDRSSGSRGVDGGRGRIAFDVGASCEGYTVTFRQVVDLASSEAGQRVTDVRSSTYEAADGGAFRFVIDRFANSAPTGGTEGRSSQRDGAQSVAITRPKPARVELPRDVMFPSAHTKRLIEAARAGETTVSVKIYDGSDDGETIYDSLAVIGKPVERSRADPGLDEAARAALGGLKSWPMTISYFKGRDSDAQPVYVVTLEMFENGVSRDLKLDFGSLVMRGELKQLSLAAPPQC